RLVVDPISGSLADRRWVEVAGRFSARTAERPVGGSGSPSAELAGLPRAVVAAALDLAVRLAVLVEGFGSWERLWPVASSVHFGCADRRFGSFGSGCRAAIVADPAARFGFGSGRRAAIVADPAVPVFGSFGSGCRAGIVADRAGRFGSFGSGCRA